MKRYLHLTASFPFPLFRLPDLRARWNPRRARWGWLPKGLVLHFDSFVHLLVNPSLHHLFLPPVLVFTPSATQDGVTPPAELVPDEEVSSFDCFKSYFLLSFAICLRARWNPRRARWGSFPQDSSLVLIRLSHLLVNLSLRHLFLPPVLRCSHPLLQLMISWLLRPN